MALLSIAIPCIIIYAISGFENKRSTAVERCIVLLWILYPTPLTYYLDSKNTQIPGLSSTVVFFVCITISISGLSIVSIMIRESGLCKVY